MAPAKKSGGMATALHRKPLTQAATGNNGFSQILWACYDCARRHLHAGAKSGIGPGAEGKAGFL
jgi:hypothetical protein